MHKRVTFFLVISSALVALTSLFVTLTTPQRPVEEVKIVTNKTAVNTLLVVDIEGAVQKPGVYELPANSRLVGALIAAGGLVGEADRYFVARQLNLAKKLVSEEKIYIPYLYENPLEQTANAISINRASLTELELLPHIGKVSAQKIIDNRPFTDIADLVSKRIISQKYLEDIQFLITL